MFTFPLTPHIQCGAGGIFAHSGSLVSQTSVMTTKWKDKDPFGASVHR